jgi:hypothetical protein
VLPPAVEKALQPSADRELLLAAVEASLRELETLCGTLERTLMQRRWSEMEGAICDSRRVTHALQNAMDEAGNVRDAAFDEQVFRRLRYVFAIRDNQMKRLQQYRSTVSERLTLLARWKAALKAIGSKRPVSRLASLDQLT